MKKQEILMNLVLAFKEKKWDRVEAILLDEGMVPVDTQPELRTASRPSFVNNQTKTIANTETQNKFTNTKTKTGNGYVNNFVDDMSLDVDQIQSDKILTSTAKRTTRRPPLNNDKPVETNCHNCGSSMIISSFEANLRSRADASFTCGACLKNLRRSR